MRWYGGPYSIYLKSDTGVCGQLYWGGVTVSSFLEISLKECVAAIAARRKRVLDHDNEV